jgi:WD40 repeat protein
MPSPAVPPGVTTSSAVAVSPDGTRLCVGTRTGAVVTWDLSPAGAANPSVHQVFESGTIRSIAFDVTGNVLAAVSGQTRGVEVVTISDDGTWRHASSPDTHSAVDVAFAPDRSLMTVGLAQNEVQVWDTTDPTRLRLAATIPTDATPSVQITGPGGLLVIGTDAGTVSVWSLDRGPEPYLVQQHRDALSAILDVTLTPDATTLAAATADGMVWVWKLRGGEVLLELDGSLSSAYGARFVAGGAALVAAGERGIVRSWTLDPSSVRTDLCGRIGDPLTPLETTRYLPKAAQASTCPA